MNINESITSKLAEDRLAAAKQRRRQLIWLIWVPLTLAVLLILAAAVLISLPSKTTGVNTSALGSVSFLWLSAPAILGLIVLMVLTGGLVYLMAKFLQILPGFFHKVQFYARFGALKVQEVADKVASPVIAIETQHTRFRTLLYKLGLKRGY